MKNIVILLLLFVGSCATSKTIQSNPDKALSVSFNSIGSGIDYKAVTALDKYIEQFQTAEKITLAVTKNQKGKEGEQSYCINLKPLKAAQQTKFIDGAKQVLSAGKWVTVAEKEKCE